MIISLLTSNMSYKGQEIECDKAAETFFFSFFFNVQDTLTYFLPFSLFFAEIIGLIFFFIKNNIFNLVFFLNPEKKKKKIELCDIFFRV